jgi:glycerate 2-kinase
MVEWLMGKAFVGLNKRLINFRGVGKDRFRQSWDDVPVPVSRAALNGVLQSGIETIAKLTKLEEKVAEADVIFTGEGSLDKQSLMGKVPVGVVKLAKKHGKKVIGIAGRVDTDLGEVNQYLDAVFSIQTECRSLEDALAKDVSSRQVRTTVEQILRFIR